MKANSHPSLVLHLPKQVRFPASTPFHQPRPELPKYYYDPRSGRWYQLQNEQYVPETYEEQLTEAGDGHSFWAIMKEAFLVLLLVGIALGTAVGCVCLLGFEEPILRIAEGIVTWFSQLKLII